MARKPVLPLAGCILGAALFAAWTLPPLRSSPLPCPGGRFRVEGDAVPGGVLLLDGDRASLPGRCPAARMTVAHPARSVTAVRTSWKACAGTDRLRIRLRFAPGCEAADGVVVAGEAEPGRRFRALRVTAS
ncbi:MAG: hypothetical protein KIT14_00855 [bacterium]|nr:hypothetical protein [bacterium]